MHRCLTRWIPRFLVVALVLAWAGRADARRFLDAIGEADKAILNDLHNGRIVEAHPFGANQNTGSLWKVKIEHNGSVRWAIFKPRTWGDRDGWARTPMEVAIYKLNRILGLDAVPPTAYRRDLWVGGQHFAEGALMVWVDDAHALRGVDKKLWQPRHEPFASDLRILQMIGRDADHENGNNVIRGKHWKDGKYRVMKVDNEAAGRHGAYVELHHNSALWGQVNRFNPETYARLKELSFADLKMDVGEFLSDHEIRDWLATRDKVVQTIERLRQEKGDSQVFFAQDEIAFDARRNLGRKATAKETAKFEQLMAKKGVKVEYVDGKDLRGAAGRTVLGEDGITVRLARSGKKAPTMGTLVEELVHVNQLRSMSRQAGGLAALSASLKQPGKRGQAVRASMEAYAKGKVALVCKSGKDTRRAEKSQHREQAKVVRVTKDPSTTTSYWRTAMRPSPRPTTTR